MRKFFFILFVWNSLGSQPLVAQDYHKLWEKDYQQAETTLLEHYAQFAKIAAANNISCKESMAVVFPELLRYSLVRDLLETELVEHGYINYGGNFADFSIGPFQMKPSFIETLERYVCSDTLLDAYQPLFSYSSTLPEEIRKERVQRIKNIEYQLQYLSCFLAISFQEYEGLRTLPEADRVKKLATLYNAGFGYTLEELTAFEQLRIFPYGSAFGTDQYSYAGISEDFYLKHAN